MYVREKLIGLLKEADFDSVEKCRAYEECESCPNNERGILCRDPFAVDYLISHGVTVQEVADMNVRSKDWNDGFKRGYEDGYKVGFNADKWISVEDRLPKEGVTVLVVKQFIRKPYIDIGEMVGKQLCCASDEYCIKPWLHIFTHWMPLPKLPKGD